MAAFRLQSVFRLCPKCSQFNNHFKNPIRLKTSVNSLKTENPFCHQATRSISISPFAFQQSSNDPNTINRNDYPDFEVSHDEFKYVEQILPPQTVPDVPKHEAYPTPSGWFPPDVSKSSQQKYLVRRTKNHMLPVYSSVERKWYGTTHRVTIRKIEGDIWALEAELRDHLLKRTGLKDIKTRVHEVARYIHVRGLHADEIANFLFERGM